MQTAQGKLESIFYTCHVRRYLQEYLQSSTWPPPVARVSNTPSRAPRQPCRSGAWRRLSRAARGAGADSRAGPAEAAIAASASPAASSRLLKPLHEAHQHTVLNLTPTSCSPGQRQTMSPETLCRHAEHFRLGFAP